MDDKRKDYEFIRGFTKITLKEVCKEVKVDPNNFRKMEISKEKLHNIKLNIDNKINKLYEAYNDKSNSAL